MATRQRDVRIIREGGGRRRHNIIKNLGVVCGLLDAGTDHHEEMRSGNIYNNNIYAMKTLYNIMYLLITTYTPQPLLF